MDLIHIRLDDRHDLRRHGLEAEDRRTAGAHPNGRDDAKRDQDGKQKSDPEIDDRLTHYTPRTSGQPRPAPQDNPALQDERLWSSSPALETKRLYTFAN